MCYWGLRYNIIFSVNKNSISSFKYYDLAIINGLITSIILETIILIKQDIPFLKSLKTAMGMSIIAMISMEIAMNVTDYVLTGGAILNWWIVPIMLTVGFLTPWPYNYWRLKKYNQTCH